MSEDRKRDGHIDPAATGVRWFKLYEKLDAGESALAFATRWNGTDWIGYGTQDYTVWSGPNSIIGFADDYVQAVYMATSRRWEVIQGTGWGWARLTTDLNSLTSCTARIWFDVAGTMTDSTIDITVWDRLLAAGESIVTLTRVRWEYDAKREKYYVVNAACDADTSSTVWGT